MPDLTDVLEELRRFPEHPPSGPPSLPDIEARARRRTSHRRSMWSATAVAVFALAAVSAVRIVGTDDAEPLRTVDDATATSVTSLRPPSSATPALGPLVVVPDAGLEDGQLVRVEGDFPATALVTMCAAEVVDVTDRTMEAAEWCDINVVPTSPGEGIAELAVARMLQTAHGEIDCAERPGRCVVGVRDGPRDLAASISFRTDLGPVVQPTLAIEQLPENGDMITVRGEGFAPDRVLELVQCTNAGNGQGDREMDNCDQARASTITTDRAGRFETTYVGRQDLLTYRGWVPCDPCVVRAGTATIRIVPIGPGDPPERPTVRIVEEGPYAPGALVTLEGSGFGSNSDDVRIEWCAFTTDEPESEIAGDPTYGNTPCATPEVGMVVRTDGDGRFVLEDFPLPDGPFGAFLAADCSAPDATCGLSWHPGEGVPAAFVTMFGVTG